MCLRRSSLAAPAVLLGLSLSGLSPGVLAQASVVNDGQWRYALGAGASMSTGNTRASSFNVSADAVQVREDAKWALHAQSFYGRSNGRVTADNLGVNAQRDQDFNPEWYGYGRGDFLRDKPANLTYRVSGSSGLGRHLVRDNTHTWDLSSGLAYTVDSYPGPIKIGGNLRTHYSRVEWVWTQLSTHRVSDTTSLRQRLDFNTDLRAGGSNRAVFDSGISVAINHSLSLTASFLLRYNGDPGVGVQKIDTQLVTGIGLKID